MIGVRDTRMNEKTAPRLEYLSFVASILIVGTTVVLLANNYPAFRAGIWMPSHYEKDTVTTSTEDTMDAFTLSREGYTPIQQFSSDAVEYMGYKFLQNYVGIVEPGANTDLYIEDYGNADYYYKFDICDQFQNCRWGSLSIDETGNLVTESVVTQCNAFDELKIGVKKYKTGSTDPVATTYDMVICMNVRREIRDLTDRDLDKTLDAMYALWSTTDEEGQEKYGEDFHNITYLLQMHHFNAAWSDADHFHEGNGFLAQHIKLTNFFEAAMRLVDPSSPLPYWDFTIDSDHNTNSYDSPMLDEMYFGSTKGPTNNSIGYTYALDKMSDFAIQDGRWAFAKIDPNPEKFKDLQFGFGYLRSPWNVNPSPYITRIAGTKSFPHCSNHLKMLEFTDLMEFSFEMEVGPHASMHSELGSPYGCDMFQPLLDAGYISDTDSLAGICSNWIFDLKGLYRQGYISAPKCDLADDYTESACPFTCPDSTSDDMKTELVDKLLARFVPKDMDEDGRQAWADFVCGGDGAKVFSGDHAESASPADPSFWPIHPTLERIYHAKMMVGGFETTEWASDPDADFVCFRSDCYTEGTGIDTEECCFGHYEFDQMYDFTTGDRSSRWGPTNHDVMKTTDPTADNYNLPYVYDNFIWPHCQEEFEETLEEQFQASLARRRRLTKEAWRWGGGYFGW